MHEKSCKWNDTWVAMVCICVCFDFTTIRLAYTQPESVLLFIVEASFSCRAICSHFFCFGQLNATARWLEINEFSRLPFVCCYLLPFDATTIVSVIVDHKCECNLIHSVTRCIHLLSIHGMNKLRAGETDFQWKQQ